jgi:hypothetical protein
MGASLDGRVSYETLVARVYGGYLALQAVLGIVLWIALATTPTVQEWFELVPAAPATTDSFAFADLGIAVVGSGLGSWAVWNRRRWAVPATAFTAGAMVYPTAYLMGWVALTSETPVALAVMLPASSLTCWIAYQVYRNAPGPRTG